jgi:hypothetical protein
MDALSGDFGFMRSKISLEGSIFHLPPPRWELAADGARPSIAREERYALRVVQVRHLGPLGILTAIRADCERGVQDEERAVEGIDDAHGTAIGPR